VKAKNNKPHFHVTAALIWKNGKILIAKRPKGRHFGGFWELPGGKQEKGESLRQCLEREIREELGMRVITGQALPMVSHEYTFKSISLHPFHCAPLEGEPKALGCEEIRWVAPSELVTFNFPPPDIGVIEAICRRKHEV
jgi:A/G-specific adenine glycosylase